MHSVRLEPAKLILVGTGTTYQVTGDISWIVRDVRLFINCVCPVFVCVRAWLVRVDDTGMCVSMIFVCVHDSCVCP